MDRLKQGIIDLIIDRTLEYLSDKVITEENIDKVVNEVYNTINSITKEDITNSLKYGAVAAIIMHKANESKR